MFIGLPKCRIKYAFDKQNYFAFFVIQLGNDDSQSTNFSCFHSSLKIWLSVKKHKYFTNVILNNFLGCI